MLQRLSRAAMAALVACGLASAQAGAAPKAPSGPPIVIGAILSITGPYAPLGEPERNALQLAEREINAAGGINGRPVAFKILDDEGKADTAQQLATQLAGEKVALIIGGSLTPTSRAISRVATEAKIVQLYPTPTQDIWNTKNGVLKYVFEVTPRNELEAEKLAGFIKTRLHKSKIAIFHDDQQYGTVGGGVFSAEAKRQGMEVVDDEAFAVTATDMTPQLQKARAANADIIVIWTAAPAAPILVRQIKQFGSNVAILGSTGIVSENFLKVSGAAGYGVYADQDIDLTHPSPQQRAFKDAYRAAYKKAPVNFASFVWDAAHLAALGLQATKGNASGDALAAYFESMPAYRGTTGEYKFAPSDHNGMRAADIRMVIENGAWETLPRSKQ